MLYYKYVRADIVYDNNTLDIFIVGDCFYIALLRRSCR